MGLYSGMDYAGVIISVMLTSENFSVLNMIYSQFKNIFRFMNDSHSYTDTAFTCFKILK